MFVALDHVALAVHDLDVVTRFYRTLLGREPDQGVDYDGASRCRFQLPNMALELGSASGPGGAGERIERHLAAHGEGIWALAFAATDFDHARRKLLRRGLAVTVDAPALAAVRAASGEICFRREFEIAPDCGHGVRVLVVDRPRDAVPPLSDAVGPAPAQAFDHVVINTAQPERALTFYGARLGLDLALDRTNPDWNTRLLFFRCGGAVIEVAHRLGSERDGLPDQVWGLAWRLDDVDAARERLIGAGVDVSEVRRGRKPGTRVCTVRDARARVPTLLIGPGRDG